MKVTKYQLAIIADLAKKNYIADNNEYDNNDIFLAQCWLKACESVLKCGNLELPKRTFVEALDEIDDTKTTNGNNSTT